MLYNDGNLCEREDDFTLTERTREGNISDIRVCLLCNHENPADATLCARCSAPLRVGQTLKLSSEEMEELFHEEYAGYKIDLERGTIGLYLVGRGQPLIIPVEREITLGRRTPEQAPPTVDFTDHHGALLGVSREHAVIQPTARGYTITDLGSTNGTWVNGERLPAHKPRALVDNDQIRLGDLIMFFFSDARSI